MRGMCLLQQIKWVGFCAVVLSGTMSSALDLGVSALPKTAPFERVLWIVLENTDYADAIKEPFLKSLADTGALLTNCQAEGHPSQGNYLAMISGSTHDVSHDGPVSIDANHLGDLIEAKGLSWKVYAEKFPGNCYLGPRSGKYVRKHVPFLSFVNIQKDSARCANIVNADQFDTDSAQSKLPNFSFYVPDLNNDGHDTSVTFADRWLKTKFGKLFQDATFMKGLLVIVTFDEADYGSVNQVYTSLFGPMVNAGHKVTKETNHYSLLKLVEDAWGLGNLGLGDATAAPIDEAIHP